MVPHDIGLQPTATDEIVWATAAEARALSGTRTSLGYRTP